MKKVLSVILMLAMVFSLCIALASCKNEENKPQESQNPDQSVEPVDKQLRRAQRPVAGTADAP